MVAIMVATMAMAAQTAEGWHRLPNVPDPEGFAGAFAGVSRRKLLVAGGANFPGKRLWEGGTKSWYDDVYALDRPDGAWKKVGKLPRLLGYGVSATYRNGLVCAAGSDPDGHRAEVFRLELNGDRLRTTSLRPLPIAVANGCGTRVGTVLYVAGGQERPDSTSALARVFTLDLAKPDAQWVEIAPIPGPGRILAAAAEHGGAFFVAGGAELSPDKDGKAVRRYLRDGYRYDAKAGWSKIADLPYPVVAAASPAPSDRRGFVILGGDDGSKAGFTPIQEHPGFSRKLLRYDARADAWKPAGDMPVGRVTAPTVRWSGRWVLVNGEDRPGVRSPEVWGFGGALPGG